MTTINYICSQDLQAEDPHKLTCSTKLQAEMIEEEKKKIQTGTSYEAHLNVLKRTTIKQFSILETIIKNNCQSTPYELSSQEYISQPEVKIYLNKIIGLCLAIIFLSVIWIIEGSSRKAFPFYLANIHSYLFYIGIINFFSASRVLGELWEDSAYFSDLEDIIAFSFSFLWILARFFGLFEYWSYSCAPLVVLFFFSMICSLERISKICHRFLYSIQFIMVTLKMDGFLVLKWRFILLPAWGYLLVQSFIWLRYLYFMMRLIKRIITGRERFQNQETLIQIIGYSWCIIYYGLAVVGMFVLEGISDIGNKNSSSGFLNVGFHLSLMVSVLLLTFTLVRRKYLIKFIITSKFIDTWISKYAQMEIIPRKDLLMILPREKKETYFLMISATYFIKLDKTTISTCIINFDPSAFYQEKNLEAKESFARETYKTDEITLEITQNNSLNEENIVKNPKLLNNTLVNDQKTNKNSIVYGEVNLFCYICCSKRPNAILVNCGHGGVCFDCIVQVVAKKGECTQCRQKVDSVYKIKPDPIFQNIYLGVEFSKIVFPRKT